MQLHAQYIILMATNNDNRPLKDFVVPSEDEPQSSIVKPMIQANNFKLKSSLLKIVQQNQLSGSPTEDLNQHIFMFVQYVDTLKNNGIDNPLDYIFSLYP